MTTVITSQVASEPTPSARGLTLSVATPADLGAVLAMVTRCSRTTLFRRFHGFTDGLAYTRVSLQRSGDCTLVAWNHSTCVGIATLNLGDGGLAHLGVLVQDDWQRRGVGSHLIEGILARAGAAGVATIHADVLSDAPYLLQVLRRFGPITVVTGRGTFSAELDLHPRALHPS